MSILRFKIPHFILLIVAVIACLVLPSLTINMDLHLRETYYVMQGYLLPVFSLLFSLAIWLLYIRNGNRIRRKSVAILHLVLSLGLLLIIAVLPLIYAMNSRIGMPRRYYANFSFQRYSNPIYHGELLIIAFVMLLLVQILFLFNLKRPSAITTPKP